MNFPSRILVFMSTQRVFHNMVIFESFVVYHEQIWFAQAALDPHKIAQLWTELTNPVLTI